MWHRGEKLSGVIDIVDSDSTESELFYHDQRKLFNGKSDEKYVREHCFIRTKIGVWKFGYQKQILLYGYLCDIEGVFENILVLYMQYVNQGPRWVLILPQKAETQGFLHANLTSNWIKNKQIKIVQSFDVWRLYSDVS